jgi:hypothetical protein
VYDNFFINLAVHTSLLKIYNLKKLRFSRIYTPLALLIINFVEVSARFITISL